jgi:hypothetical protein
MSISPTTTDNNEHSQAAVTNQELEDTRLSNATSALVLLVIFAVSVLSLMLVFLNFPDLNE